MSNIHGFGELSEDKGVGIQNSNSYSNSNSNKDDRIYQPSIYKMRTVTFVLLVSILSIYVIQLIAFYAYFQKNNKTWGCLLVSLGAFQVGKIKNHYQYFRFFTSMFLHNSLSHAGSNSLSLFFLGFQTENEMNNFKQYILLYFISGLEGNFLSMLCNQLNISAGASGAIIGLCGNFVIYFLMNYRKMSQRKKYSYGIMFMFLFINLFSGLSEGGESINMASHIGGFLGGFAYSIIVTFKNNIHLQFNNKSFRRLYYISFTFLLLLPIVSLGVVFFKNVSDSIDYICN
jgi:membrane associated rhomboid family serine protease